MTDNPQIISGSTVAIFDPHHAFTQSGGATFDFIEEQDGYVDQLAGFEFFLPPEARAGPSPGTIIRLPLRTVAGADTSRIKNEPVKVDKMRQLFQDFIDDELAISMLFLTSISSIELWEVDERGRKTCLANAELTKSAFTRDDIADGVRTTYRCNVRVSKSEAVELSQDWRILQASYSDTGAADLLSARLGYDATPTLSSQKLRPEVAVAMPFPIFPDHAHGRLYTYLPLPLSTGFPCHIHGLFALTPDRQHLRNGEETGVVEGSDRYVARLYSAGGYNTYHRDAFVRNSVPVAWNSLLFDTYIPRTWAHLLPILLENDQVQHVFDALPLSQPIAKGGDTMYWNSLPLHVLRGITQDNLRVWPISFDPDSSDGSPLYSDIRSVLVAPDTAREETLQALAAVGVMTSRPPQYVTDLLVTGNLGITLLDPHTVHVVLLVSMLSLLLSICVHQPFFLRRKSISFIRAICNGIWLMKLSAICYLQGTSHSSSDYL